LEFAYGESIQEPIFQWLNNVSTSFRALSRCAVTQTISTYHSESRCGLSDRYRLTAQR